MLIWQAAGPPGLQVFWSHHEVEVESLSAVSKVPETLQALGPQHCGELVLVGAPEQLLVRQVSFGQSLGAPLDSGPQCNHEQEKGDAGQHV